MPANVPVSRRLARLLGRVRIGARRNNAITQGHRSGDRQQGLGYDPHADGHPDPGEVVWTWVPFEDDPSQGKDRPVLLIGREEDHLLGLMLTSKDHDRDAAQEARWGRRWMDVGTGDWDARRRPSEVRLDRLLRIDPGAVRREGCALDRARFEAVLRAFAEPAG